MPRRLPPLNALRAFEVAGRHGSFTKAAAELNVTHGAVSRQVALLEAWLGNELFRRTPSQVVLTEAGRAYLAEATAAFDRIALASSQAARPAAPRLLRISAPPTFTMKWLLPRVSGFQHRRPDTELRLTTSLAPVDFAEQAYDLAIRGGHAPRDRGVSVAFMTETIVPVCHVDLLDGGRLREPADLASQVLISYATEPYAWSGWLAAAGVARLRPAATQNFEQMYFALQAATEGLGVVLVPLFLALDDIIAGRLCVPFGALGAKQRRYYAHASGHRSDVDAFVAWLVDEGQDTERAMNQWAEAAGWPATVG